MRTSHYLFLPLIIGVALLATILAISTRPTNAQPAARNSREGTAYAMITPTLVITAAPPVASQPLSVTVTFTNPIISVTVSSPLYTVQIASADAMTTLVPESVRVQHGGALVPNTSDRAWFTFYPVAGGQVTLTAIVTVSVQLSPPASGEIGWRAQPITVFIPVPSQAAAIIYENAYRSGCMEEYALFFQVAAGDEWGSYSCAVAAGHSFGTSLARTESPAAATDAFNASRGDHELEIFHCHRAYSWSGRPHDGPITYSGHGWVADHWVNISHAEDDTPYGDARGASEGIYRTMRMRNVIGPCSWTYLPLVSR